MATSTNFMENKVALNFEDPSIFHDRILIVGNNKFYVVSGTLSMWSEYFRGLFNSKFEESNKKEIELKYIDADTFEIYLKLIYHSNLVTLKADDVIPLIEMSYRFLTPLVLKICTEYFENKLSRLSLYDSSYAIKLLKTVCTYGNEGLKIMLTYHLEDAKWLSKSSCLEILEIADGYNLNDLKNRIGSFMAESVTARNCSEYLDYCAKFNSKEMKSKIVKKVKAWEFDTIPKDLIIDLAKNAFKHDVLVLKAKIRENIYCMADEKSKNCIYRGKHGTRVTAGFSANWYLQEYQNEIFALPAELSKFIAISASQGYL